MHIAELNYYLYYPERKGNFKNNILIMFLKIIITWINTIIQYHKIKCSIYISDLIRREDIHKLQSGVKYLLKNRTSNRFLTAPNGLEELCKKIDQMDSTLLCWYETTDCGIFEFQNHPLEKSIDYFTLKICNINSGYLSLQFNIYLSELKMKELNSLISCNYKDKRGFAVQSLTKKSNASGAYKNYSITHYNDNYLKADKIYEFM